MADKTLNLIVDLLVKGGGDLDGLIKMVDKAIATAKQQVAMLPIEKALEGASRVTEKFIAFNTQLDKALASNNKRIAAETAKELATQTEVASAATKTLTERTLSAEKAFKELKTAEDALLKTQTANAAAGKAAQLKEQETATKNLTAAKKDSEAADKALLAADAKLAKLQATNAAKELTAALKTAKIEKDKLSFDNGTLSKLAASITAAVAPTRALEARFAATKAEAFVLADRISAVQARLVALGSTKLAVNVDSGNVAKFEAQLRGLNTAADNGQAIFRRSGLASQQMGTGFKQAGEQAATFRQHASNLTSTLSEQASSALFLRRVIIGLGFSALGREVLDTVLSFDKLRSQFAAVFKEDSAAQLAFIRKEADRLGISVFNLGDQYAKFVTATKGTSIEGEKARQVFLATAEAASRLGLAQEDLNGALTALQQIASKGRLSLEELRQQLGDRLPGAVRIAAESLGITQARLFKLIETGQIDSNTFLSGFGEALRKNFGTDANTRIETLRASLQRVKTAFDSLLDKASTPTAQNGIKELSEALVKFANNPDTVKGLQDIINAISTLTRVILENRDVVKTAIGLYLLYKTAVVGLAIISSTAGLLSAFGFSMGSTVAPTILATLAVEKQTAALIANAAASKAAGAATLAPRFSTIANSATAAGAAVGNFSTLVKAAGIVGALATAAYLVLDLVVTKSVAGYLDAKDKVIAYNSALKDISKQQGAIIALKALGVTIDAISESYFKNSVEVSNLTKDGLAGYIFSLKLVNLSLTEKQDLVTKEILLAQAQIDSIKANVNASKEEQNQVFILDGRIKSLLESRKELTAQSIQFNASLETSTERLKRLTSTSELLDGITYDKLTKQQQGVITSFDQLIESGKSAREAMDKVIPPDFARGTPQQIADVIQVLRVLEAQGKLTTKEIREGLQAELAKLTGDGLLKFQTNAQFAFDTARIGAKGLAEVLEGAVEAALAKFGLNAETAGTKVSKTFADLQAVFAALAQNASATAAQVKAALDSLVVSATTKEELEALRIQLEALAVASGKFGPALSDTFDRLADKARSLSGVLDNALGDSFKRLGALTKQQLGAAADQAAIDFARIRDSGLASLEELKIAFAKFAEDVLRSTGKLTIDIIIKAKNLDAFDIIVKAAQTASEKVKDAFDSALGSAKSKAQLESLRDAIVNTFNAGRITAEQYGSAIDAIATKTFELTQQVTTEFSGALARLGVQSKQQLKDLAEQLKADFAQLTQAGQFTAEALKKAFTTYAQAAIAANDGVADSFLRGQAEALGLGNVLDSLVGKLETLADSADNFYERLKRASTGDIITTAEQQFRALTDSVLRDVLKSGRINGVDLDSSGIAAAIAELERRLRNIERLRDLGVRASNLDPRPSSTNSGSSNGTPTKPSTTAGGFPTASNPVFNFNSPNISPDGVKNSVLPTLVRLASRGSTL